MPVPGSLAPASTKACVHQGPTRGLGACAQCPGTRLGSTKAMPGSNARALGILHSRLGQQRPCSNPWHFNSSPSARARVYLDQGSRPQVPMLESIKAKPRTLVLVLSSSRLSSILHTPALVHKVTPRT